MVLVRMYFLLELVNPSPAHLKTSAAICSGFKMKSSYLARLLSCSHFFVISIVVKVSGEIRMSNDVLCTSPLPPGQGTAGSALKDVPTQLLQRDEIDSLLNFWKAASRSLQWRFASLQSGLSHHQSFLLVPKLLLLHPV